MFIYLETREIWGSGFFFKSKIRMDLYNTTSANRFFHDKIKFYILSLNLQKTSFDIKMELIRSTKKLILIYDINYKIDSNISFIKETRIGISPHSVW